ncbi:hypothetical protein POJ06DRAFT_297573 [Lipomyces tetrasporus]|uniref:Major facilitator superfamily (MFS) profile domain-containing protein n=1 Tax=Lipomyces tetrasporus TaxID=54092 RepID=A0AAD7QKY9_9ASCO|nr:uncharacterized protein POJ06DRAFT_297573 [Lipomyces tetrasporus]KAJ8097189.1 hypothetical protein POJ06DRAFT_297573 [Lipomyces tetrasporus]
MNATMLKDPRIKNIRQLMERSSESPVQDWLPSWKLSPARRILRGYKSGIVSILSAETTIGSFSISNLIIECAVFLLGVVLQCIASAIALFAVGRFFAGLGLGFISAVVPLYQSEAAPKWIRGAIVSGYQLAITVGLLLASVVNNATQHRNDTGAYRIPSAVQFACGLVLACGMVVLPESPNYFVTKGKLDEARKSLGRLSALPADHEYVIDQLLDIRANYEYELSFGSTSFIHSFANEGRQLYRLLVATTVQAALQQLCRINFIFYYGTDFFQKSGINDPFVIGLSMSSSSSRLPLACIWSRGSVVVTFYWLEQLACVAEYIVGIVGVSVGSSPGSHSQFELDPTLCTMSNWLWNFGIGFATPYMVNSWPGKADMGPKVFFIWGTFCLFATVFVYLFVYEIKGLSLEQVDELYEKVSRARDSPSSVPSSTLAQSARDAENVVANESHAAEVERV